ncbi:putative mitochondrial terminal uridylyltransferase 3, putative (TUT3) [Leptomonas pyrrhocoris]|uniref:RNA uridylyltransferase n=1 Tax=Leptomonas pyrrhocoris TaxID=157538 RepID=A0A0N0VGB0_LEPPY|nr:putative mitochondrial terminal uridylyltransferase 3, putative (TUT3) [Leptomonas pyrrhocoris]XP_015661361.1 putative mitochondrial terminal uridylyltransferase 3, putative (TUT3) [Leptomonas pyrrhocoris]KPA82921.1 putative mitochondrial terminal uridylyltransferase 3, putative (TUT3) [Leptomonas pyrrhocoris]KPA82922.1 putative mitochondrial terminal uridylyltransferase 3, putative (TUT3) [Leptomonas pyrrhocoris]|eukprot:XP_015661360.1 putative mitochondrial terminal uridylyltransferase 3, putative (TUT3) [Leptomonas pyrrhocoris]
MTDSVEKHEAVAAFEEKSAIGSTEPKPTPTSTTMGYVKCSLCNQIVDDEVTHVATEHRHLQHIYTMLRVPLAPPSKRRSDDADLHAIGVFAMSASQNADRGAEAFQVMQRAQMQLQRLTDGIQSSHGCVYAFGSVVSMGSWDGVGDGDFAFIEPTWFYTPPRSGQTVIVEASEDAGEEETDDRQADGDAAGVPVIEDEVSDSITDAGAATTDAALAIPVEQVAPNNLSGQVLSPEREKGIIRSLTARLRDAGFRFEELDPVLHTRIPVVRRKRPTHEPLKLRAMRQDHLIRVSFERFNSEEEFCRGRLHTLLSTYNARVVQDDGWSKRGRQLVLAVPDGCDAVHLMSRRERIPGVRKEWLQQRRTPEIFAVDFDLSCRFHGIRNSWLLRRYMEQDEVFRVGNVFLKKWSKACGINNSRVGFLTSYAVSVLWVYFLLRRGAAAFVAPADVPILPDPEKQMEVPYMPLWPALGDADADAARTIRLGALLRDFFYFYGEEFDWATQVVSIRQPCRGSAEVRTKRDLNWLFDDTLSLLLRDRCYHIFSIEDVYEDDLDLGRHLTEDKAAWTRLQFRLAYARCGKGTAQLMCLLDVPRKRASDVLRVRLFDYLLLDAEDADSAVGDLDECLCREDEDFPGEDPVYLLAAYELGNRLSDLWYDKEQIGLDVSNHRKHDRRANLYVPPEDPTAHGEWGLLCTDPLPAGRGAGSDRERSERRVQLQPPRACETSQSLFGQLVAVGAPKRQREVRLTKARNQYLEVKRGFAKQKEEANARQQAATPSCGVVGMVMPKSAKESAFPHCFYTLQTHRLFSSYHAREVFLQCLEDVAWEVTRLHEEGEAVQLDAGAGATVDDRHRLFEHLMGRLRFTAMALPGYEEVLFFATVVSSDYVQLQRHQDVTVFLPSPLLLHIVGADGSAPDTPMVTATARGGTALEAATGAAAPSALPHFPAARPAQRDGKEAKKDSARFGAKPVVAVPPPLKMNPAAKKIGTCGECGKTRVEIFPSNLPERDAGFYCAKCWSRY